MISGEVAEWIGSNKTDKENVLNRHNFEIAELASTDEDRLIFCGINVTPEGTQVTDGHLAVMVSSLDRQQASLFGEMEGIEPADCFTPFVLDRESALKIARAIPKKSEEPIYPIIDATSEDNDRAMISVNDLLRQEIVRARKIEGKFPAVEKLCPDKDAARHLILMSPDLLLAAMKTISKFCKGHELHSIELRVFGPGKGLRIDATGLGQSLTAVIMPQRSDVGAEE